MRAIFLLTVSLLCSAWTLGNEITDFEVKDEGDWLNGAGNDLSFVSLSFKHKKETCKIVLPRGSMSIESQNNDNPYLYAKCIGSENKYIQARYFNTHVKYVMPSRGGMGTDIVLDLHLVDVNKGGIKVVKISNFVSGRNHKILNGW